MYCRSLMLTCLTLLLGGCASYDYYDYDPYPRRYSEVRSVPVYPVYGGPVLYGSNFETRSYNSYPRNYNVQRHYSDQRYDNRRYDNRGYDQRRYDQQRHGQPRYYRGQDGRVYPYQQLRGHDRPRYVAPPKNAQKHYQHNGSGYRQDMRSAPPGSYRGGPRY
ncbi:hypothetical protein JQX08_06660 [Pseudomonas sp. UL073]|uniref:Lipoprotein n=1 Tax=Zestomonas insulae TaxID=2809017 RepID=A0ABS2IEN1_9GAMM|nr:hypothetical protein [Pseudomonas insulae]MBM7060382.1 hypothetical protein [Pseudomonas insulae]